MWLVAICLFYLIWRVERIRLALESLNRPRAPSMADTPSATLWSVAIKEGKQRTLLTIGAWTEGEAIGIVTKEYPQATIEKIRRA